MSLTAQLPIMWIAEWLQVAWQKSGWLRVMGLPAQRSAVSSRYLQSNQNNVYST